MNRRGASTAIVNIQIRAIPGNLIGQTSDTKAEGNKDRPNMNLSLVLIVIVVPLSRHIYDTIPEKEFTEPSAR